ncbi:cytochrome c oxidase assembly protein [Paracoccus benzoatiresistens]|uniref:Cytochrome c oxidase assembly protein n=1 Tax=Paracoccus benzoatiresistens TaxID=2997341 RepID=A0ABT4J9J5_9RHOB|nr:cytochrome c oxidase assembly protein [Paracoccus sp. EF6]MCZ0963579.1 cytochrome c oxidase assembly protein [Paracoccus sp. EF6]
MIPDVLATGLAGLYCGPAPDPGAIWARWNLDPLLLAGLVALALVLGRSRPGVAAVAVLAVAFVSPLCALSAALFSARVVHHLLLVAVAAPLIALAWPARTTRTATPLFVIATGVLWAWHLPQAYDAAMANMGLYWVMQATLLGSATAFWRAVLAPGRPAGQAGLATLGAYMQMGLLGALLTFAPDPLYGIHQEAPLAWGFTPLADQQLGGIIMWVPAGIPYAALGALVALRGWRQLQARPT